MKRLCIKSITIVLILVGLACPSSFGQQNQVGSEKWDFQLTPYFWMAELDADATLGGLTGSAEMDFSDLWDFIEFGASARLEAWKQRWGLLFDTSYLNLGADFEDVVGPTVINVDSDVRMANFDFGIAYRLVDMPVGENQTQRLTFEPLGGVRYAYLKEELKLNVAVPAIGGVGTRLGGDEGWVEPFVGARIWWHLNDKIATGVRVDFGGFGIGSASDLTWNFLAEFDYKLSEKISFKAGYRIMDMDYEGGSGRSRIGIDGQMRGPIVGLTFHF